MATGSIASTRAGRAFVELFMDDSKLNQGLRAAKKKLKAFGSDVSAIGRGILTAGLLAAAPLVIATKRFADFDDAMRKVQAVLGATSREFDKLGDKARALGKSTSFTASQVAGAMLELGRAGFDSRMIDQAIASVLDMARASSIELPDAALIAINTMNAFELSTQDMVHVMDILVATANNSAQTMTDLGEAMVYAAPIAKEFGASLEETALAIGLLANFGIKASKAGTSLRTVMTQLGKTEVKDKIKKMLNVEVVDEATGSFRKLAVTMGEIGVAVAKMPRAKQLEIMQLLFQKRALGASIKLTKEAFDNLGRAIDRADGIAARTAETMDKGLGGMIRRLLSAIDEAAISIGDALAPELIELGVWIKKVANDFSVWVQINKDLIVTFASIVKYTVIIGGAIFVIGKFISALSVLSATALIATKAMFGLGKAVALVAAHPVIAGLAVLAVVIGVAALAMRDGTEAAEDYAEAQTNIRREGEKSRAIRRGDINRLKTLSSRDMNKEEIIEAKFVIGELNKEYKDLGITVDDVAKKIDGLEGGAKKAAAQAKKEQIEELKAELKSLEALMEATREDVGPGFTGLVALGAKGLFANLTEGKEGVDRVRREAFVKELRDEKIANAASLKRAREIRKELSTLTGRTTDPTKTRKDLETQSDIARALSEEDAETIQGFDRKIAKLRLRLIADDHDKRIAQIKDRYNLELSKIEGIGASYDKIRNKIREVMATEIAVVEALASRRITGKSTDVLGGIEEEKIRNKFDGREEALALLRLEEKRLDVKIKNSEHDIKFALTAGEKKIALEKNFLFWMERSQLAEKRRGILGQHNNNIEELQARLKFKGVKYEREILKIQQRRALEAAKDSPVAIKRINEEFDLRNKILEKAAAASSVSARGIFLASNIRSLQGGGLRKIDKIIKNGEDVVKAVDKNRAAVENQQLRFGA